MQGADGALCGTTNYGGSLGAGTLYKLNTNGTRFTILKNFDYATTGGSAGGLVQQADGTIFGTTFQGGSGAGGTLLQVKPNVTDFSVLVNFDNEIGAYPSGQLSKGSYGDLFGTTGQGGNANAGTMFRVSFSVIPQQAKMDVLSAMNALRKSVTNKEDVNKLDEGIKSLTKSLDPALWLTDGRHLEAKHGQEVFNKEKEAVAKLQEIIKNKKSTIPAATLRGFIDGMLDADEALAKVAIADAASADPKKLAKARDELAKAAADETKGKFDTAIEHYRNAWKQALEAMH